MGIMRCVVPFATQIFLVGILIFFERLDGFILPCPASNIKSNPHEYLDETESHGNLLKKLYKSSNVLQVAPKAKITQKEETQELEVQKDLSTEILEVSRDINLQTKSYLEGLKNDQHMVERNQWLQKNQRKKDVHIWETLGHSIELLTSSILKFWSRLTKSTPHEYLDETGSHGNLLKELYKSSNILQMAPKAKITQKEKTQELKVQKDLRTEILEVSRNINLQTKSYLEGLKNNQNMVQINQWLQKNQRKKDLAVRLPTKRRGLAEATGKLAEDQVKHNSHTMAEKQWKLAGQQVPLATKAKIAENKEKTDELEIQKEVTRKLSETLKVKRWPKVTVKDKIKRNKEKIHESKKEKLRSHVKVAIEIIDDLNITHWLKSILRDKIRENDKKTHKFEKKKEVIKEILEDLKVNTGLKVILKEKIRRNKEKIHGFEIQKEVATEISEVLKLSKGPKVTPLKDKMRGNKEKTQEFEIQKEVATEISEALKIKRWPNVTFRHLIIGGRNSRITTEEPETLNKLLPDKTLSNEVHWEYQEQITSAPFLSDFLSSTDNFFLQDNVFEAEVQKQLAHLILNEPRKSLIAHLIRMIKVNCRESTTQTSCDFLISRIGLVMKLLNKRKTNQEASALLKSDLLLTKNETNMTIASSRKWRNL